MITAKDNSLIGKEIYRFGGATSGECCLPVRVKLVKYCDGRDCAMVEEPDWLWMNGCADLIEVRLEELFATVQELRKCADLSVSAIDDRIEALYRSLDKIEEEEEERKRMLIFICSPYAGETHGDIDQNIAIARRMCLKVIEGEAGVPIAPHLHYPQFLNDTDPDARAIGMRCSKTILQRCDAVWVYNERISSGMQAEIDLAYDLKIQITYINKDMDRC
jgi:hypothetical protein